MALCRKINDETINLPQGPLLGKILFFVVPFTNSLRLDIGPFMDWLHQVQIARQNPTRHSQMKKQLVLSGFLHQKFAEKLKEVGQIVPESGRISLCLQKETKSGFVWLNLANFLQFSFKLLVQETRYRWNQQFSHLALSGMILSGCLGLGVARA